MTNMNPETRDLLIEEYRTTFERFKEQEAVFETLSASLTAAASVRPNELASALAALEKSRQRHSAARDVLALSLFFESPACANRRGNAAVFSCAA